MKIFVIEDIHFGHENIIKYQSLPFAPISNIKTMQQVDVSQLKELVIGRIYYLKKLRRIINEYI